MKLFIKRIFLLSLPVLGFILLTFWQADGKADPFYLRFTTPKQHSLILGTSRGAQGIVPHVIDSVTGKDGMFNYAMTVVHSPYGEVYFESVKEKLISAPISAQLDDQLDDRLEGRGDDQGGDKRDGLFVLEVSPWSISNPDENVFKEANSFVSKLHCVDCKPNIEYLMRFYPHQYLHLWRTANIPTNLQEDGWLEVDVTMAPGVVQKRTEEKMKHYKNDMLPVYHFSETRYGYLKKTIALLQNQGRVFLVRIPVYPELYDLENVLMADFDGKMKGLCESEGAVYFNFGADGAAYRFTDGNHLWKGSAERFSIILGEQIQFELIQDEK